MLRVKLTEDDTYSLQKLEELSTVKIAKSNDLVTDLKKEVQKYQKLLELAENDRIDVIKNEVSYFDFDYCFDKAKDYFEARKQRKLIEKGLVKNKSDFDYIVHKIEKILGIDGIKIESFSEMGYQGYAYLIYFSYMNITFELVIPNMELFDKEYYEYAHEGKICLFYKSSENSYTQIASSYDECEVEKKLKEFLESAKKC